MKDGLFQSTPTSVRSLWIRSYGNRNSFRRANVRLGMNWHVNCQHSCFTCSACVDFFFWSNLHFQSKGWRTHSERRKITVESISCNL